MWGTQWLRLGLGFTFTLGYVNVSKLLERTLLYLLWHLCGGGMWKVCCKKWEPTVKFLSLSWSANYATSDILCDVHVNVWRKQWFRDVSKEAGWEVDRQEVGLMTYWRQRTVHWDSCCGSKRPPSMERNGPFSIQPSALMKDQEDVITNQMIISNSV